LNLFSVKSDDVIQLGQFKIEFFGVAHSIPSSMGVIVTTPAGIIVHTGDFKLEEGPGAQSKQDTEKIKALGERGVLALMCDSTNASKPGRQIAEQVIQTNIDEIIKNAKGRVIIGTFASMIARVQQISKLVNARVAKWRSKASRCARTFLLPSSWATWIFRKAR
jgi:ribonuclease J